MVYKTFIKSLILTTLCILPLNIGQAGLIGGPNRALLIKVPVVVAGGSTIFGDDKFTDTDSTALESHTPTDIGTSWANPDGGAYAINSNHCFDNLGFSANYGYYLTDAPSDADYKVSVDVVVDGSGKTSMGPMVRRTAVGKNGYFIRWSGGDTRWELIRHNAGSATNIAVTHTGDTPTTAVNVELSASGGATTRLKAEFNGVLQYDLDDPGTPITAAGFAGIYGFFPDVGVARYVDNFLADNTPL